MRRRLKPAVLGLAIAALVALLSDKTTLAQITDAASYIYTVRFTADVSATGDLSPAQLTGDQNDYNPTSLSTASVLRLDSSQMVSITGLAGGADGRIVALVNVGSQPIHLVHQSTASSAANRFAFDGGDFYLGETDSAVLVYDSTASRWRTFSFAILTRTEDPMSRIVMHDDLLGSSLSNFVGAGLWWGGTVSGTGASCQTGAYGVDATNKAIGVAECDTGTTATGYAGLSLGAGTGIVPAQGSACFAYRIAVESLSTSSQEYVLRVGLHDGVSGAVADGVYFEYDRATAGDFWRIAAAGGSTRTLTTTSQAVTTNYIWLMGITNAAWTSVDYFAKTNGATTWTDLGNIADGNLPTATELVSAAWRVEKTVGTTQVDVDLDAFCFHYQVRR